MALIVSPACARLQQQWGMGPVPLRIVFVALCEVVVESSQSLERGTLPVPVSVARGATRVAQWFGHLVLWKFLEFIEI